MQEKLLHKVHNFVLNYKFINLNENYFDNNILQDKLLYIYHNHHKLNMEVFLPQIINTKKHTKTASKTMVSVQYISRNILHFYKGYFTNFYHMKALIGK